MCTLFEAPVNPMVAVLYKECKEECKFTDKSDSDFLLFLLNSAVRILNVVKDFSPLLDVSHVTVGKEGQSSHSLHNKEPDNLVSSSENNSAEDSCSLEVERLSKYEDLLLDKIEKSGDVETLQKYIDKVQRSIEGAQNESRPQSETDNRPSASERTVPDDEPPENLNITENSDYMNNERNSDLHPEHPENQNNIKTDDVLTDALSEILDKTNFEDDLKELARLDLLTRSSNGHSFSCALCFSQFKNQRNLSRHMRHGVCLERSFKCTHCSHSFSSEYGLKRHLSRTMCRKRVFDGDADVSSSPSKIAKHSEDSGFLCDRCNFSFSTKAALIQHASSSKCDNNRLHGLTPSMSSKEPKQQGFFECPRCKSTLASKAGLAKHLKRGQCRVYQCPDCSKSYRYLHEVRSHRKLEHRCSDDITSSVLHSFFNQIGGVPSMTHASNISSVDSTLPGLLLPADPAAHKCKVCSYAGTCKRSLENHMRMHVRQLKAIGENTSCTQCAFFSEEQSLLLKHYITCHPGLPYFKMAPKGTLVVRSNRISEVQLQNDTVQKTTLLDTVSAETGDESAEDNVIHSSFVGDSSNEDHVLGPEEPDIEDHVLGPDEPDIEDGGDVDLMIDDEMDNGETDTEANSDSNEVEMDANSDSYNVETEANLDSDKNKTETYSDSNEVETDTNSDSYKVETLSDCIDNGQEVAFSSSADKADISF